MTSFDFACGQMLAALDDELAARRSDKGRARRRITLVRGERVSRGVHSLIYRFANQHELRIDEGSDVEVQIDGKTVAHGELLSGGSDQIMISVGVDLGAKVDRVVLVIDDAFPLERLQDRLTELRDNPVAAAGLAAALLTQSHPAPSTGGHTLPRRSTSLNEEQGLARVMATRRGVSYLWGPPGTGKTTTLAAIVADYVDRGLRVLLLANTNVAVDVALQRVATEFQKLEQLENGRVVRYGAIVLSELSSAHGDNVDIDKIIARKGGLDLREQIIELERYLAHAKRQVTAWSQRLARCGSESPPRHAAISQARLQRTRWLTRVADLKLELSHRRELNVVLQRAVVDQAQVVATTVYKAYLHEVLVNSHWDVVVIDEASMLPPPIGVCVAALAGHSVLVAGDFRQLPPIVEADTALSRAWLATDLFHLAGIPDIASSSPPPPNLTVLREQHRMHPAMAEVVSKSFYPEAPLRSSNAVVERDDCRSSIFATEAVVAVDTTRLRAWATRSEWGSPYNVLNAQVAAALASGLLVAHDGSAGRPSIGAIAPYRAQAALLEAVFRDAEALTNPAQATSVAAGTVHRFQGNERDVVLLDLVSAGPLRIGAWFRDSELSATGPRMLNVAISRARHQLVLIGNLDWIARRGSDVARRLLAKLQDAGCVVSAGSILSGVSHPPGVSDRLDMLDARQPQSVVMQIDDLDLALGVEPILRRLAEAGTKTELVLRCPGDRNRLDNWSRRLERLRTAGVAVYGRDTVQGCLVVINGREVWGYRHRPGSLHHPSVVTTGVGFANAVVKTLGRRPLTNDAGRFGEGPCLNCGRLTVRLHGPNGSYSRCPSIACAQNPKSHGPCPESGCAGLLVVRQGRRGPFLGCSTYPTCTHTTVVSK